MSPLQNIRRSENSPFRLLDPVHFPKCFAPAENTLFTGVYFLPSAN